jgi:hypothetical protein
MYGVVSESNKLTNYDYYSINSYNACSKIFQF